MLKEHFEKVMHIHDGVQGNMAVFITELMALLECSQQGYALFDSDDVLRFANNAFRTALGVEAHEFPSWLELMRNGHHNATGTSIETSDFELWLRSAKSRRGKLPFRTIETGLKDGRWVLTTETSLAGGWMLCVVTDVSELSVELRELRQERDSAIKAALSDELTGVGNRRFAMESLNKILGPNKAEALAAVIVDIDHFKVVNDRFGHARGDEVLKHFASKLSTVSGRDDLVGRIGGEEFLLILRGSRIASAESVLQQLFASLADSSPFDDRPDFRYSCSAGVAIARPGEGVSDVLLRADVSLYHAKSSGRNRYVFDAA